MPTTIPPLSGSSISHPRHRCPLAGKPAGGGASGNSSLYNAAASLSGKAGASVGGFVRLIETLRQETSGLPLPEMVEHVIENRPAPALPLARRKARSGWRTLDELINAAVGFRAGERRRPCPRAEAGDLAAFLTMPRWSRASIRLARATKRCS